MDSTLNDDEEGTYKETREEEIVISFLEENCEEVSESSVEPVRNTVESPFVEPVDSCAHDHVVTGMWLQLMAL
jgi:hypothetical protein